MTTQTYELFTVRADRETGEWLGEPESAGWAVEADAWNAETDTDDVHFDTFERDGVTCAIRVEWVD